MSLIENLKTQPDKEEVDLWAGPVHYKPGLNADYSASSNFIRKVEQKHEDEWENDSEVQSSIFQTLTESEKINKMNAWIAK